MLGSCVKANIIQLCLEKERKTDVHTRSRSHELKKKAGNEFKLDYIKECKLMHWRKIILPVHAQR